MKDFEKIYSEYYDAVYRYVLSLCKDASWAEEITQESFFRALKYIGRFRGQCSLRVWLTQIAKNTYFAEAKRRKRQTDYPLETIPSDENIEETVFEKDALERIRKAVRHLEEPYRSVFLMHAENGSAFKEIAASFGRSESWARVTYYRAKLKIKERIQ